MPKNKKSRIQNPESIFSNPWTTLSSREVYDNNWIAVTEHQVTNPAGNPGIYGKVHFKNKAIGIIPIDDQGNTWLVGQWRYPLNQRSWEIPEGGGELATDPLLSAQRELKEETGITATRWTQIIRTHLSNSVTDEEGFVFLAEGLSFGNREAEETEADMKVMKVRFQEAITMVMEGKITDSLSVMGILKIAFLKMNDPNFGVQNFQIRI
jgi:8-oxo-dGTP pyrophosphatase MutT (NUDIX family)